MIDKVAISVVSTQDGRSTVPLVFDLHDIKKLRELGIVGILSGTLPSAAQQNVFLSVPLRLIAEEALWLVVSGYAYFTCDNELLRSAVAQMTSAELLQMKQDRDVLFDLQREHKLQQHLKKLESFGVTSDRVKAEDKRLLQAALFVDTPNASTLVKGKRQLLFDHDLVQKRLVERILLQYSNLGDYFVYKALKEQQYFLSPGARFGGKFIAYPGDPLRYHSHMAVQPAMDYYNQPLDLMSLISGGRLGTGVKKLWVVGGVRDEMLQEETPLDKECEVSFFSVEWAGFG